MSYENVDMRGMPTQKICNISIIDLSEECVIAPYSIQQVQWSNLQSLQIKNMFRMPEHLLHTAPAVNNNLPNETIAHNIHV